MNKESFDPEETARRRDAVVRRMANTSPQPRPSPVRRKKKKPTGADQSDRKQRASDKGVGRDGFQFGRLRIKAS
jgi:hypothetical protein